MVNLLSRNDILKMRGELNLEGVMPKVRPPVGREYWDVYRIVATLEAAQQKTHLTALGGWLMGFIFGSGITALYFVFFIIGGK